MKCTSPISSTTTTEKNVRQELEGNNGRGSKLTVLVLGEANLRHLADSGPLQHAVQTESFDAGLQAKAMSYSAMQFPMSHGPQGWKKRPRSPGLKWYKGYDTPESLRNGRVLVIDYVKHGRYLHDPVLNAKVGYLIDTLDPCRSKPTGYEKSRGSRDRFD